MKTELSHCGFTWAVKLDTDEPWNALEQHMICPKCGEPGAVVGHDRACNAMVINNHFAY